MLRDEDIICFSSIDWDFNWQGHQEIMSALARAGNRVLFVENTGVRSPRLGDYGRLVSRLKNWRRGYKGIRQLEKNLYVYSPLLLPFPYSTVARWLNRSILLRVIRGWCRSVRFSSPIVWSFLPSGLTLEVIEGLGSRILIYYCIDSFVDSSPGAARIRAPEEEMIRRADLVFVTSEKLREHCQALNEAVHKFPFTVNYEPFELVREDPDRRPPAELGETGVPIAGYVGGLHRWVDQELLAALAEGFPECRFVLVGPEQEPMDRLRKLPNVILTGHRPHAELPLYLKGFAVGLIPYLRTPYTDNVYPTKLNEYLAMGLPVVSTPIREIELFGREHPGLVDICTDAAGMAEAIRRRLALAGTPEEAFRRTERIEMARSAAWPNRIEQMSELIEERLSSLRQSAEIGWRGRLDSLIGVSRRRFLAGILALGLIFTLLFQTPLVYMTAHPLASGRSAAERSDLILVFGGGVGETGRPGSSTFERAIFATDLYHRGLGGRIVFSSGYQQYTSHDAENMSRVALADRVPANDIIIDERASNNYWNVMDCLALMDSLGLNSAIVVTGGYNCLRTRLLIEHNLGKFSGAGFTPDSFHIVPVERSIFWDPEQGSRLDQWRAVIKEYMALAWYKWKGWI